MWQQILTLVACINGAFSLSIYNYNIRHGQPLNFSSHNIAKDDTIEYNFVAVGNNAHLKLVCDKIEMGNDCSEIYLKAIDSGNEKKICGGNNDNFVYKSRGNELKLKIVAGKTGSVLFDCTAFNNAEPSPEIIQLHPNGKAVMIGGLENPVPYYDHLWELNSPEGTKMSFQCVIGMIGTPPNCGKNVFIFDDSEQVTEHCESDYLILFSKSNKARIRVQLDEQGDGYFECLSQAVTGPNVNEFENVISKEVDSSEHGVTQGSRNTSCKCGWANKNMGRIVNGIETRQNEFPWMVYLEIKVESGNSAIESSCGASIITARHILTAAHCMVSETGVNKPENIKIVLGKHNSQVSTKYEKRVMAEKIFIRNEFLEKGISHHDIAIILTKERIEFNEVIGPVCLEREELPIINRRIVIMGWGLTEDRKPSPYLRKSKARVMDLSVCGGNEWDVCTMTSPSGTCSGDSGGPLVWLEPETNRYTQVSLVSRGHDDCISTASLSTLIAYFYDWIQEIIKSTDPSLATCGKV
uniref:Venom s1 protease 20 n=1 Tax=Pristhesancus plagipennis TaxID=1955184 RepID=A0A1Q1NPF8_PRIPG|nr:venom s1 protease 20 [Pristhesancus plagipennis]